MPSSLDKSSLRLFKRLRFLWRKGAKMKPFKARRETLLPLCCLFATSLLACLPSKQCGAIQDPPAASQAAEWINLFDGQTLSNWIQRGGKARFRIEDDCIVASTIRGEPDSFLCTEREFGDFELQLEFQVMAEDSRINSGVQFRSQSLTAFRNGIVHGYQIEIDPSDRAWTGGIYDQNRRGWLFQPEELSEAKRAFKLGQWNTLRLVCMKDSIKTWVNQVPVSDIRDDQTLKGFIALQIHSTQEPRELQIRWRNIRIRELLPP